MSDFFRGPAPHKQGAGAGAPARRDGNSAGQQAGGAQPGNTLRERFERVKEELVFGEVAVACALAGSSRRGWDCPACGSEFSVRERRDHLGGRCAMEGCGKGYDMAGLVMEARGISALQAAVFLERLVEEKAARGNPKAPGLFGGEL